MASERSSVLVFDGRYRLLVLTASPETEAADKLALMQVVGRQMFA